MSEMHNILWDKQLLPINVWEHIPEESKEYLDLMSRYSKQEILLDVDPYGWVIRVFSVDNPDQHVTLRISKDHVTIVTSEDVTVKRS